MQLLLLVLQVRLSFRDHGLQSDHFGFKSINPLFAPFLLQLQLLARFLCPFGSLPDFFFQFGALFDGLL
jgi:hypothetical protein